MLLEFVLVCWFSFFARSEDVQSRHSKGHYSRVADSLSYSIDDYPMPSFLNLADQYNALLSNGTVTLADSFKIGPVHRHRRHRRKRIYSDWSDWSSCSETCTTFRQRHCVLSKICGSDVVTESSYCYTEGSRCRGAATNYKRSESDFSNKGYGHAAVNFTCGVTVDSAAVPYSFKTPRYSVRIMGGQESTKYHWPWQVAVLNGYKKLICGGTLVAPGWVLTAAHCSRQKLYVRLKEYDLFVDEGDEIDSRVVRVIVHPRYNPNTIDNDMALLKLHTLDLKVNSGYHVQPACLPVTDFQQQKRKPAICVVIGWGKVRPYNTYGSRVLREARVPIVGRRTCRAAYRRYLITENMICAGYRDGRSDTCTGDSGGPLLCRMRGRWTVVGVTSFGDGCGRQSKYGIYASVVNNVRWIVSAMTTIRRDDRSDAQ